jgi:RND superfamily putative drug exporter
MLRLAGFLTRRRWLVVGAWLAVVIAAAPLAQRQTEDLTGGGFDVPGSESEAVERATETEFASAERGRLTAVIQLSGAASAADRAAALERLSEAVADAPRADLARPVAAHAERDLAADGLAVIPLDASGSADELIDTAVDLREDLDLGEEVSGARTYMVGQPAMWAGLQELSKEDLESAEVTGFPIVALILLAVFGSLAAAALPLALGLVSVLITGALIYLVSQQMDMSVFVTNMASMIGIGVAVDYSLFIVARFREEVRAGMPASEARAEALATSGLAVAFSGLAVIVSLAGLWMVDNQALRSMALGAMMVVAVAILVATTLLPALIRLLGHRVEAGGVTWSVLSFMRNLVRTRRRRVGSTRPDAFTFWQRWTALVMKRPVLSVSAVAAVLLTLAIPVLSLETGNGAIEQFPKNHDARVGVDLATQASGGGADPVRVLARFDRGSLRDPGNAEAVRELARTARSDPEVAATTAPVPSDGSALLEITPRHPAESDQAQALVDRLRDGIVPASGVASRAEVDVGGEASRIHDARVQIDGSMWRIVAFVLALSFVVLLLMLRSLLLPLKAILMNLLSIGAAYGVLVAVFQWGWLDGFLGFQSLGKLDTLTPPLVLAVVFGLSMDYEVFLLSRIRERYGEHGDNSRAVAEGLASSARTISSAALIMTAVFAVFILTGVPSIKELGLGNAVAISLDATLVRLILVPAAMQLMGRWNWWLPGWLDRLLPDLSFEGVGRRAPQPART